MWQLDNTRLGRVGMHCLPADVISGNREGRSLRSRARLASVYCAGNQVETFFFALFICMMLPSTVKK